MYLHGKQANELVDKKNCNFISKQINNIKTHSPFSTFVVSVVEIISFGSDSGSVESQIRIAAPAPAQVKFYKKIFNFGCGSRRQFNFGSSAPAPQQLLSFPITKNMKVENMREAKNMDGVSKNFAVLNELHQFYLKKWGLNKLRWNG